MVAKPPFILGIGEALWDILPTGPRPGGAPLNLVHHAIQLGAKGGIISAVGNDELGRQLRQFSQKASINVSCLQTHASLPTGTVEVTLEDGQPSYDICRPVAWDDIAFDASVSGAIHRADAVVFGTLAARDPGSRRTIQRTVEMANTAGKTVLFDVNFRADRAPREFLETQLHLTDILKLSEDEAAELGREFVSTASPELDAIAEALRERFQINTVAVTQGARGCHVWSDQQEAQIPSDPVKIADAVGAGDAFTASLLVGLLMKRGLLEAAQVANQIGGYVASQSGAMPPLPQSLITAVIGRGD